MVFAGAILCLAPAYAQKVVEEGSMTIIDASVIPHTKTKKACTTMATDRTLPPVDDLTDIASEASNEKVYIKFEVSKTDNEGGKDWLAIVNHCAGLTHNGKTGWRLPTQRELMLMYVLKPELEQTNGFDPFNSGNYYYWSATDMNNNGTTVWGVYFGSGTVGVLYKSERTWQLTRCIRDI